MELCFCCFFGSIDDQGLMSIIAYFPSLDADNILPIPLSGLPFCSSTPMLILTEYSSAPCGVLPHTTSSQCALSLSSFLIHTLFAWFLPTPAVVCILFCGVVLVFFFSSFLLALLNQLTMFPRFFGNCRYILYSNGITGKRDIDIVNARIFCVGD